MNDKQTQKAGANSQQLQIAGNYYAGVSPVEARAIADEAVAGALATYTSHAMDTALARASAFNAHFVEALVEKGLADALKDPAFQLALQSAQKSAAASDAPLDESILVGLMIERAAVGGQRAQASALQRASEAIPLLDDEALAGLVAYLIMANWVSLDSSPHQALSLLDGAYNLAIGSAALPSGEEWIEHLEGLGLARVTPSAVTTRREAIDVLSQQSSFTSPGVPDEEVDAALDRLSQQCPNFDFSKMPVPHEFALGRHRLRVRDEADLRDLLSASEGVTLQEAELVVGVARDTWGLGQVDDAVVARLKAHVGASYPAMVKLHSWWDSNNTFMQPTLAGRYVADAYIKHTVKGVELPHFVQTG